MSLLAETPSPLTILTLAQYQEELLSHLRRADDHPLVVRSEFGYELGPSDIHLLTQVRCSESTPTLMVLGPLAQTRINAAGFHFDPSNLRPSRVATPRYRIPGLTHINHMRYSIVAGTTYVHTYDLGICPRNRHELITRIDDPELAQHMKIIGFWNFKSQIPFYSQRTPLATVLFDPGKNPHGHIPAAITKILNRTPRGSTITLASPWYPDETSRAIQKLNGEGCQTHLLVNSPFEWEGMHTIPFNVAKWLARLSFRSKTTVRTFEPTENSLHGRFLVIEKPDSMYEWLITSSNMTRIGTLARPAEFAITGTHPHVARQLLDFYETIPKREIR